MNHGVWLAFIKYSQNIKHDHNNNFASQLLYVFLQIALVVSFGLYLGVLVSTSMVSYLEEYNIFVPEDEDDD